MMTAILRLPLVVHSNLGVLQSLIQKLAIGHCKMARDTIAFPHHYNLDVSFEAVGVIMCWKDLLAQGQANLNYL